MEREVHGLRVGIVVATPKPPGMRARQPRKLVMEWGSLTTPTAPQMTDVSPKQMRGSVNP